MKKQFKDYENLNQFRVVSRKTKVDLYPKRSYSVKRNISFEEQSPQNLYQKSSLQRENQLIILQLRKGGI